LQEQPPQPRQRQLQAQSQRQRCKLQPTERADLRHLRRDDAVSQEPLQQLPPAPPPRVAVVAQLRQELVGVGTPGDALGVDAIGV
jgi:hypothetical protein